MQTRRSATTSDRADRTNPGVLAMERRAFLCKGGALALGMGLASRFPALADEVKPAQPNATKLGWKVSVQGWTYRSCSLFEGLEKAAAVGLRNYEVRTNLKLDSKRPDLKSDENMPEDAHKELKTRLNDLGISIPSVFTDFNGKPDQAKRLFEFWKGIGTDVLVAEPPGGSFDMLEKLCAEYKVRIAVHNHQKGKSAYWCPELVLKVCANRGPRIGACCDDGQWVRSDLDPVECLGKLQGRIVNYHLKDVLKKGDLDSRNTIIGEGAANNAKTLKELKRLGYQGVVTIDYEHDTKELQKDMLRNIAFLEEQARLILAQ